MYSLSWVDSGGWTENISSPRARICSPPSLCRTWNRPSSSMWFSVPASFSVFLGSSSSHVWTRLPAGNWSRRNSSHSLDGVFMYHSPFCPLLGYGVLLAPDSKRARLLAETGPHNPADGLVFCFVSLSWVSPLWQAHSIPQCARNIQQFLHLRLHRGLALAPLQPQRVIGHLRDAQIRVAGDMGGHGGAVRRELEQGLGEL